MSKKPKTVLERITNDWNAAKDSRFRRQRTNLPVEGASADYHVRSESEYYKIVEYARDMERNDSIIAPAINTATRNIVGEGFIFNPASGNKTYDEAWYEAWEEWSNNPELCDIAKENTWNEQVRLACHSTLVSGDHLVAGIEYEGQLRFQAYESDQIRTPYETQPRRTVRSRASVTPAPTQRIILGVELDQYGKREKYHVLPRGEEIRERPDNRNLKPLNVYDASGNKQLFHVYHPHRVSQTRGMSALAPAFDDAGMFEDIKFAKMVQQLVVSCIGFIKKKRASDIAIGNDRNRVNGLNNRIFNDQLKAFQEEMQPGFCFEIDSEEEMEPFSPNVPNPEFFQHVKLMLQLIGLNLGLPLIIMLMDASETNFSGWRGAFDQAKEGFIENQKMIIRRLLVPFMNLWTKWMIAKGRLKPAKTVRDPLRHTWGARGWPYVQPLQDASASVLRVRTLQTSPQREHAERGQEYETIVDESVSNNAYAIRKAKEEAKKINSEFKDDSPVTWLDLVSLPTMDRFTGSMVKQAVEQEVAGPAAPNAAKPPQGGDE